MNKLFLLFILLFTLITSNVKPNQPLKILSWNIYMLPFCNMVNHNSERSKYIASKLDSSEYDIIILQEAFDHSARNIIRTKLKHIYPYMYRSKHKINPLQTNSGLFILSKIPLTKLDEIEYKSKYGMDALSSKGAILLQGEYDGKLFQILGTHLQANSPDIYRHKQYHELVNMLDKHSNDTIPQFICGDFNTEFDDTINYNYMISTLKVTNGIIYGNNHNTFDEVNNELAKKINGKSSIIDYILLRNSKNIKNIYRSIPIYKEHNIELSDHYCISAKVEF
jgi:endonuclease/exonuclease/phosphatase family metal-dependent hydrolase